MNYLACDPGSRGAFALVAADGELLDVIDMPTLVVKVGKATKTRVSPALIAAGLQRPHMSGCKGVIEQVSAMPGQGGSSMFAFGEAFGIVKGVWAGMGIPFTTVTPAKWKRDMGLNASKDGARLKAIELWPHQADLFKRAKDDGRAEAALLAEWLRRNQP